mmetsp:Transcript_128387/g.369700  ORF Transcript_128387/g.369700 Transcript_128387/m.369700 type:complete len:216 (+) Transcript_128387:45-692(+)
MVKLSILASRFLCRKRSSVTPVDESDCLCSVEPTNVAKGQLVASRSVTIRKGMAVKSDPSLPRNLDAPTGYTSDVTDIATDAVTWESDSSWSSSDSQEPPAGAASGAEGAGACWSIRVVPPPQGAAALVLPDASRFDGEWVLRGADPDVMPWLRSLHIRGGDVVDGVGDHCDLVPGPCGPSVCGGVLLRNGRLLLRYGKTGRVQEYCRRSQLLFV